LLPLSDAERDEIEAATVAKAYEIIKVKGFTSYGIAAVTSTICQSIMFDERQILPVSHWQENLGCCLSLPATVGRGGIISTVQLPLQASESSLLQKSAEVLREMMLTIESQA
jgi:L-lactate dehydrogenase